METKFNIILINGPFTILEIDKIPMDYVDFIFYIQNAHVVGFFYVPYNSGYLCIFFNQSFCYMAANESICSGYQNFSALPVYLIHGALPFSHISLSSIASFKVFIDFQNPSCLNAAICFFFARSSNASFSRSYPGFM